jgi:hypothetical protein
LRGFVFNLEQVQETRVEETKLEEITEEVVDENGMVTLVRSGGDNSQKSPPPQKNQPQQPVNRDKYSKLRYTLSFTWKNGTKFKADVNDTLYETTMVLITVANAYARQAQEAVNADRRKEAYKLLVQVHSLYNLNNI